MSKKYKSEQVAEMYIEVRDEFTQTVSSFKDEVIRKVSNVVQKESKSVRNDVAKFKDEIVDRLDRIEQELTVTEGYGDRIEDHLDISLNLKLSHSFHERLSFVSRGLVN
ncbi:hypothetical protein COW99_01395 [Candidatus Roizmanbacteria bacterium CG22_combo_CG10-13_8_21_14_all_38_20]|uniref:Uncharacterized protein n=1 Tax=Candidatus Roizmanbacteria bacterium CG22_combo_CG10-13_8_21_14_all_38_20 TaxID=1974862 RepID=A0A2H0BXV3_9BACT|nr:hypothetical protein [Candidatus Microgenomates bacterium]PIP61860.1 MAG: hypothetical protein COW99_01395 [Candidatus Roizmanbacteria bacterium CG22_combo_CG10-13_8_21_14_all_38_20]PJC32165.1 MAG: hypothetical protein CO050_01560 [Candidatus Roizmanbacteria bacterium CG_4_9_14_0_2_um_filter_38_17]